MAKKSRPRSSAPKAEAANPTGPGGGPTGGMRGGVGQQLKGFAGLGGAATYLWPRWLVLRAVGLVFIFVFAGIIVQGRALIAPNGIAQLAEYLQSLRLLFPRPVEAFLHAPSLFWLDTSAGMITALAWTGLAAALALVLNLWPRMALFVCWLVFLSFTTTWRTFSPAQLDNLMLETALLCLPFAPAGFRPGLGLTSPPRPIALLMVRWLLFRVMFESGLVKLTSGDPHWWDFSAMDVMYETSPFPTIFGWWDHQMPRAYHVGEILFTFAAELAAPVLAVFGGRRGRWIAFALWTAFQAGIQLTNNFGWLNFASIGLGLVLLDDQMLAAAADRLRLRRLGGVLRLPAADAPAAVGWRLTGLRVALWAHFYLTLFFFARAAGVQVGSIPSVLAGPTNRLKDFRSANGYYLYATIDTVRYHVEFAGSNDGGRTWRAVPYRNIPQREDEICDFIAPWFSRFEATLEIEAGNGRKSPVYPAVAGHLLARNPAVMALFRRDPFGDRPPTLMRMRGYRLTFTDGATRRRTGHYWRREPAGDYLPMLYRDEQGGIGEVSLAEGEAALRAGNFVHAFEVFEQQYQMGFLPAGFRLAEMHTRGAGGRANPARAFELYTALAKEGEVGAEHYLGICYEYGVGVPIDYGRAATQYRVAASHGYLPAVFSLGTLHASDRIVPRDDVQGLTLLLEAADRVTGDDPISRYIRENEPAQSRRLTERMTPAQIAQARQQAGAKRPKQKPLP